MRQYGWLVIALFPLVTFSQDSNITEGYEWLSQQCKDLQCIEDNLGNIDAQIATLVAKRLAFVKRGAEIKNGNVLAPKTPGYGDVTKRATEQAEEIGTSKGSVGSVFETLNKQSNEYEKKYLKAPPQAPTEAPAPEAVPESEPEAAE